MAEAHDRPCAAPGLTSYRYHGRYGWIMIGANDNNEALREAVRSTHDNKAEWQHLEVWDLQVGRYVPVQS